MEKEEQISYTDIVKKHPWIVEKGHNCILSPDCDGFLCGLLMSEFLDWHVVGFYDEKILILKDGLSIEECVFLDVDIYRKNVRSIGHHMVMYNKNSLPKNWSNYENCIQACNLRNFDRLHDWQRKYPFGTIHLLISILSSEKVIPSLPTSSKTNKPPNPELPLLFADGVWINLFDYMENCLDWIDYLGFTDPNNILYPIFCDNDKIYIFMKMMNEFIRLRDTFNAQKFFKDGTFIKKPAKRSGHNLRITNTKGEPINLIKSPSNKYEIENAEKQRVSGFIKEIAKFMGWNYNLSKWTWDNFMFYKFYKSDFEGDEKGLTNDNYKKLLEEKIPFSIAITSSDNLEYTLR